MPLAPSPKRECVEQCAQVLQFPARLSISEMQECGVCGRCRPDSQTDCDCGAYRKKWPIYYGISLLLTAVIELFILFVKGELPSADLAGGAVFFFMVMCVVAASVANLILAAISARRGERWGWLLSAIGVAAWFATIAGIR
jgi:hypothetical protein